MNRIIVKSFSSAIKKQKVTFIGLGNMGFPMATNLAKSGNYLVSGFDIDKNVQEKFNKQENTESVSLEKSCSESDMIFTMLPNTNIVKNTYNDITNNYKVKKGTYFIDSSTINPTESKNFSEDLINKGFIAADAPVSGGVVGATNGTLTFMIGCMDDKEGIIFSG